MHDGFYFMRKRGEDGKPSGGWFIVGVDKGALYVHGLSRVGENAPAGMWCVESAVPIKPSEPGWGEV